MTRFFLLEMYQILYAFRPSLARLHMHCYLFFENLIHAYKEIWSYPYSIPLLTLPRSPSSLNILCFSAFTNSLNQWALSIYLFMGGDHPVRKGQPTSGEVTPPKKNGSSFLAALNLPCFALRTTVLVLIDFIPVEKYYPFYFMAEHIF